MRMLIVVFMMLFCRMLSAAQVVNVEYIHNAIRQKWDITVPYNPDLQNPYVVANMKYLLTAVDVANEILNGSKTTNYGNGEFATMVAADTVVTDVAVDTLVAVNRDYKFIATVDVPIADYQLYFDINATGDFFIDWGDGSSIDSVTNTLVRSMSHTYTKPGQYKVKLGGLATGVGEYGNYGFSVWADANNNMYYAESIVEVSGCLGCVFPTLSDGTNPSFYRLFQDAGSLTSIPDDLFAGLYGDFSYNMFASAFSGTGITSIPQNLFGELRGGYAGSVFSETFRGTPITSIPENLFSNVVSLGSRGFQGTFMGTKITKIPDGLFSSLTGGGLYSFDSTFSGTPITSIPENLFEGISRGVMGEFSGTFAYTNIKEIPENLFANVGNSDTALFAGTFAGTPITSIPENLFASVFGGDSVYMDEMFSGTFADCTKLKEIPDNLFSGLKWESAESVGYLFAGTFSGCTSLTEIPANLFGADIVLRLDYDDWKYYGVFEGTFYGCDGLTGPSARTGRLYFYERWPNAPAEIFLDMYQGCEGLSDYDCIPSEWGGGGKVCLWTDPA